MIHVIIKQERRKAPRELALSINNDLRTQTGMDERGMQTFDVTPQAPQLHAMGTAVNDLSNITYAAEWDGQSPWITVLKGDPAEAKMAYMGWPMVTQAQWESSNG